MIKNIPVGYRFGRWTVIGPASDRKVYCRCDCGNERFVWVQLLSDDCQRPSRSCGCYKREMLISRMSTHRCTHTKVYKLWWGMRRRCQTHLRYKDRGITVCAEWDNNFLAFKEWWDKQVYKPGYQIDRIDNDKGYSPDNCRVVPPHVNCRNKEINTSNERLKSFNIVVSAFGESKTLADWADDPRCVVSYDILWGRLRRRVGKREPWEAEAAITTPLHEGPTMTAFGETKPLLEWEADSRCVVPVSVLRDRLRRGWDHTNAITTPLHKQPAILHAFGESKTLAEWADDPRCQVSYDTLWYRFHHWDDMEAAISTAKGTLRNTK